jgi:hypothetical protein
MEGVILKLQQNSYFTAIIIVGVELVMSAKQNIRYFISLP